MLGAILLWALLLLLVAAILPGVVTAFVGYGLGLAPQSRFRLATSVAGVSSVLWWVLAKYWANIDDPFTWPLWARAPGSVVLFFTWVMTMWFLTPRIERVISRIINPETSRHSLGDEIGLALEREKEVERESK